MPSPSLCRQSRRQHLVRHLGDMLLVGVIVAAGPLFGRMLNSLYVPDAAAIHAEAPVSPAAPVASHDESRTISGSKGPEL